MSVGMGAVANRAAKEVDYTRPGMTREQTLEAMLRACLDVLADADQVVSIQSMRGYPYQGRWVDRVRIEAFLDGEGENR